MGALTSLLAVVFGALVTLIGARFVLCLARADPENRIVQVVGYITDPFVVPFEGIFGLEHVAVGTGEHGGVDVAALVAIAGYLLLLALIVAVASLFRRRRRVVSA